MSGIVSASNSTVAPISIALRIDRCWIGTFAKLRAQDVVRLNSGGVSTPVVTHGTTDNHSTALLIFLARGRDCLGWLIPTE